MRRHEIGRKRRSNVRQSAPRCFLILLCRFTQWVPVSRAFADCASYTATIDITLINVGATDVPVLYGNNEFKEDQSLFTNAVISMSARASSRLWSTWLRSMVYLFLVFAASLGLPTATNAQEQDDPIVAVLSDQPIRQSEIDQFLRTLEAQRGETLDMFTERGTQLYLAQRAASALVTETYPRGVPEINTRLEQLRANLNLDFIISRRLEPSEPTDDEIDAFIEANPQFFSVRAAFRYARYTIAPQSVIQRDRVEELVDQLSRLPRVESVDIQALSRALLDEEIVSIGRNFIATSEQIDADLLDKLEEMARSNRSVTLNEDGERFDLLVLLERQPDPVDPSLMRQQVAAGLLRSAADNQRQEILKVLADMAQPVRPQEGPGEEPAPDDADQGAGRNDEPAILSDNDGSVATSPEVAPSSFAERVRAPFMRQSDLSVIIMVLSAFAVPVGLVGVWRWTEHARKRRIKQQTESIREVRKSSKLIDRLFVRISLAIAFVIFILGVNGTIIVRAFTGPVELNASSALAGGAALGTVLALYFARGKRHRKALVLFWFAEVLMLGSVGQFMLLGMSS